MNLMTYLLTHRKLPTWLSMLIMLLAQGNAYAQQSTGGLTKARTGLGRFRDEILLIVPILALIACVFVGILYSKDLIRKESMWQLIVGFIIAGSAAEIVALFL